MPPPPPKPRRVFRLGRWPTPDWEYAHWFYRVIKGTLERPVLGFARVGVRGVENVPLEGGLVLAPNHYSYADPILLSGVLPRPAFYLANERLYRKRFSRAFFEANGQIMVDRTRPGANDEAIRYAADLVRRGFVVGVFPEGQRVKETDEVQRGKTGVARIALASGAPVLPIAMTSREFWPKGQRFPRPGPPVLFNIGKPMRFPGGPEAADDKAVQRRVTDEIMAEVQRLLDEALAARGRGETWHSQ